MSFKTVSLIAFAVALTLLLTQAGQLSTQAHPTGAGPTLTAQAETPVHLPPWGVHTDAPSVTPTSQPVTPSSLSAASPAPSATHTPTQTLYHGYPGGSAASATPMVAPLTTQPSMTPSCSCIPVGTAAFATGFAMATITATQAATDLPPWGVATLPATVVVTQKATKLATGAATTVPLKLAVTGTMGTNNWYTSSVTVKAVNPSGPVEFSLDGGPFLLASSIQVAADGKHQVVARYVDDVQNAVSLEVNVDQTPPVFDETHSDTQEGVHVDSVTGHDDVSGLADAYVDGNRIVLIDKAGNRAERVVAP